jgi:predicted HAD superfamily phosphohydrolase YqeG
MQDEYLVLNSSFLRLKKEYEEYGSLVIAFDFDNTVFDFHKKGETYEQVIDLLKKLKEAGCYLIVFTANEDTRFITRYLLENQIPFDSINENPPFFKSKATKIYFNALLDDRAGLVQVYQELSLLLTLIQ